MKAETSATPMASMIGPVTAEGSVMPSMTYVTWTAEPVAIAEGMVHATTIPRTMGTKYTAKNRNTGRNGPDRILLSDRGCGYR